MSIFRSGVVKPVFVICLKDLSVSDFIFSEGEKYELVLDMGTMYVVKNPMGKEAVVSKDAFVIAKD